MVELLTDEKGIYGFGSEGGTSIITRPDKITLTEHDYYHYYYHYHPSYQRINPKRLFYKTTEYILVDLLHRELLHKINFPFNEAFDKKTPNRIPLLKIFYGKKSFAMRVINNYIAKSLEVADQQALKIARRFPITYRSDLYNSFCYYGERVMQLAETFPILALLIFTERWNWIPRNDEPVSFEDYEEGPKKFKELKQRAKESVLKGERLKCIAAMFNIPMAYRRFKPGIAAHAIGIIGLDEQLMYNFLPPTTHQQRLWLKAMCRAVNYGDEFCRWAAHHALEAGDRLREVAQIFEDLQDWIMASQIRTNPQHYINVEDNGQKFITKTFNSNMSWKTVKNLSEEWHKAVANSNGNNYQFPPPWYDAGEADGYCFLPIQNNADLYLEGRLMHHCVGTYNSLVTKGTRYFYSITKDGKRVATVELTTINNETIIIGQMRGYCNANVSNEIRKVAHRWLSLTKRMHGKGRFINPEVARIKKWEEEIARREHQRALRRPHIFHPLFKDLEVVNG